MSLFDRFCSTGPAPADSIRGSMDTSEQESTRLIDAGHVLEAQGRLDAAIQCYLDAIPLAPNPARAHLNQGNVLLLKGDLDGALQAFRTAIKHKPDYAGAYYNIGNALLGNGQLDEAAANYRSALEIQPDYAEVHCSLGVTLKELGQPDDAIASFQRAIKLNPDLIEAHLNLGHVLQTLGQLENAVTCYQHATEFKPDLAEAHSNLGFALQKLGQFENAVTSYRRALDIQPDYADALNNLGNILKELGQHDVAVSCYRRALEVKPDYAEALNNLGNALQDLGQYESAESCYQRALEVKPDYTEALNNLGIVLQDLGRLDGAMDIYRQILALKPDYVNAHHGLLFALNYTAGNTPSYHLEQARRYGRIVAEKVGARFTSWQCATHPKRLRVGLVSGDLISHPVGFFLEGLLAQIDPARIELVAYPTHRREDELTTRIRPRFSEWKPLTNLSDETAARLIHADGVHVLVDLSGHTEHNRLPVFAWKPAPVQVTWLGYFATTGMAEMDYVLADEVGVPEAQQGQFIESVWYLPDTRLCFTTPLVDLPVAPLPALSNGMITFGCFQNLTKLGDEVLETWGEILAALPNAKLRLQCKQLGEPAQMEQLLQRCQHHGISHERVMMHKSTQREAYLAAHAEIDMILDTFPYPGGTTTCEALWMGVPTLTLAGDSLLARQGASLLTAAGLPEWVAASRQEYISKAIALAGDYTKLAALRSGLRQQVLASPLFDAPRFARHFENALWGMWQRHQAKPEKPA
ncbi:MAG: Tetratricopeptide TPR_2 repeat protein [Candidatus Gallionella acididurans]|uniref:protein O-GlcNAc transferase n=1 Tax=Candidatus Gallionella acididurans TaxID=1796491 RepID=A0A139BXH3_9PROT|nr:MAG: Tetratricopeptide TPR_2 repeat protein [Candidatus Gallionella acididurans]